MKIYNFEVIDRCLFLKSERLLVIGDLHLGYEDGLSQSGVAIPRNQLKMTFEIFNRVFLKTGNVKKIILLGDIKHFFGKILRQEREDVETIINFLCGFLDGDGKIIITAGNHDKILLPLIEKYNNVSIVDRFVFDNMLFIHGDAACVKRSFNNIKDKNTKLIILGHFHPAYLLKDKKSIKEEKFKCFLYGKSKEYGKNVIFVPSFFPLIEGGDIKNDLEIYNGGMRVVLITDDGKTYNFNKP